MKKILIILSIIFLIITTIFIVIAIPIINYKECRTEFSKLYCLTHK